LKGGERGCQVKQKQKNGVGEKKKRIIARVFEKGLVGKRSTSGLNPPRPRTQV